jgi:hypothetical protein
MSMPQERPTVEQYDRYLSIVKFGRECGGITCKIAREGPFFMADPGCQFTFSEVTATC